MAWIQSHQALGRHPKLFRLSAKLRVSRAEAIGHLHYLWWWALDYAPLGDLSGHSTEEIAAAAEWPGKADAFVAALQECGWLDPGLILHDWDQYGGRLMDRQVRMSQRQRDMRKAYRLGVVQTVRERDQDRCRYCGRIVDWTDRRTDKGGMYDHVDPDGPSSFENLVVSCRACNTKKGRRTPEEAGLTLIKQPLSNARALNDALNDALDDTKKALTEIGVNDCAAMQSPDISTHPDAKEKAKNDGAISNDKGLSVHLIRQDKNRLDKKGGGGASNDKSVNGDRPLYIREYDSLITDAREEIQRLSFLSDSKGPDGRLKPEILKTIQDLKERIREWKSAKFGVQLPGPKSRTQDNQPQSQA